MIAASYDKSLDTESRHPAIGSITGSGRGNKAVGGPSRRRQRVDPRKWLNFVLVAQTHLIIDMHQILKEKLKPGRSAPVGVSSNSGHLDLNLIPPFPTEPRKSFMFVQQADWFVGQLHLFLLCLAFVLAQALGWLISRT